MILSASGWRKIFAKSGTEQDVSPEIGLENTVIAVNAAAVFADYLSSVTGLANPVIACGIDTRPTGPAIADTVIRTLLAKKAIVRYTGISAAPEIMAYARKLDGFIYISASHNPIGHNGIKFGLNNGGVLSAQENAKLVSEFIKRCTDDHAGQKAAVLFSSCKNTDAEWVYAESAGSKRDALAAYHEFMRETISATDDPVKQDELFMIIKKAVEDKPDGIVCDMNGSARTLSIDHAFFAENNIAFYTINDKAGAIVHEIIPEAENLVWCADEMERLQKTGEKNAILGYMPDCDGDRGNIVYWNEKEKKAVILKAQEVFSLSVLSELAYSCWLSGDTPGFRQAVAVNGPTSLRIEKIASAFNALVFRAEVGEANVVNLAREKRADGYTVRICGEGSNGGTITFPSSVRDPLNTLFAIIKLLVIRDTLLPGGKVKQGLFRMWCEKTGHTYTDSFTLSDVLATLPSYTTTGVSEKRAVLHIQTADHAILKSKFQKIFERDWNAKKDILLNKYGIYSYEAVLTNGTKETRNAVDFSKSGKGGLKIHFFKKDEKIPFAFIWMRGSGTEPVFRVMCDVQGNEPETEAALLQWESDMLAEADA